MSQEFLEDAMADADDRRRDQQRHNNNARQLTSNSNTHVRSRALQEDVCQVYFNGTIFRNNTQGPIQGVTTYGIVTARSEGHFMSFDDCLFVDNVFGIREVYVSDTNEVLFSVWMVLLLS
jgi:hypothetical protein